MCKWTNTTLHVRLCNSRRSYQSWLCLSLTSKQRKGWTPVSCNWCQDDLLINLVPTFWITLTIMCVFLIMLRFQRWHCDNFCHTVSGKMLLMQSKFTCTNQYDGSGYETRLWTVASQKHSLHCWNISFLGSTEDQLKSQFLVSLLATLLWWVLLLSEHDVVYFFVPIHMFGFLVWGPAYPND